MIAIHGLISYADEVVLIVGFNRENEIEVMNSFVRAIEGKLAGMGLELNADKTQVLLVSREHDKPLIKVTIENKLKVVGKNIKIVEIIKYIGVLLDENLFTPK